jgi:hypothetical protein
MRISIRSASAVAGLLLLAAPAAPQQAGPPPLPRAGGPGAVWVEETFNGKAKLGARSTVDLTAARGEIAISGIDGDMVRVTAAKRVLDPNKEYARTVLQNLRVQITERGGGVEILTEVPEGRLPPILVNYAIGVPFASSVTIRSFGGAIRVDNVKGELRAETFGGGDMTLSAVGRVRAAKSVAGNVVIEGAEGDDVNAETYGGRLQVRDVRARSVELRSISGAIIVTDSLCDRCTINTVSGSIEFSGALKPEGRYSLNSQSGDIRLAPAGNPSFDLEAMTAGRLMSDFPLRPGRTPAPAPGAQGRILRGIVGSGSSILSLRSFTGNVSILRRVEGK